MSAPRLPAAISAAVKAAMADLGFSRVGRSYRKPVNPPGGLMLTWSERESLHDARGRHAVWEFSVLPRAFVEAVYLVDEKETPFERLDPAICSARMVFKGPPDLMVQDVSYRPDDPQDVAVFADALVTWVRDAVALGEVWVRDPGALLDALDAEADRCPLEYLRRYSAPTTGWLYRPVLELAAGRIEAARRSNQALLASDDPTLPPASFLVAIGRLWAEHYPQLRAE